MDFSRHIANLLYNYECVVIPGLGGLITNDKSSQVNRVSHNFNPPYSKIFFNKHLTTDDGLLTNHIALIEGVSFNDARIQVEGFVEESMATLGRKEIVSLAKIGTLKFDSNKNIVFEQDIKVNYNPYAFGLSGFVSPPIKRQTDEELLRGIIAPQKTGKSKPADRKEEKAKGQRKGVLRPIFSVITLALLISGISWALLNFDNVESYLGEQASLFPFSKSNQLYSPRSANALALDNSLLNIQTEDLNVAVTSETDVLTNLTAEAEENDFTEPIPETIKSEPVIEMKPEPKPVAKPASKLYYIVAGSFSSEVNASKLVQQLREKGFDASVADTNKNGMYRVAYEGIESLALAKEQLLAIRQEDNPDAWILRK